MLKPDEKKAIYPFVLWERIKSVYGIVVSSGGNPSDLFDHSVYPAVTGKRFSGN